MNIPALLSTFHGNQLEGMPKEAPATLGAAFGIAIGSALMSAVSSGRSSVNSTVRADAALGALISQVLAGRLSPVSVDSRLAGMNERHHEPTEGNR